MHAETWTGSPGLDAECEAASRPTHTMTLSKRQQDVTDRVCRGESNKEIARSLGLAEGTVKRHLTLAMMKLGVSNRTQLAIKASQS